MHPAGIDPFELMVDTLADLFVLLLQPLALPFLREKVMHLDVQNAVHRAQLAILYLQTPINNDKAAGNDGEKNDG